MSIIVPGEWEKHSGTIVAWPTRPVVWQDWIERAYDEYSCLIGVIAEAEPVLVVATLGDAPMVKERLASASAAHVITHPIDDGWIRDNGPIFAESPDGIVALDFKFNSWGNRFSPSDGDCSVSPRICSELNVPRVEVSWVLEGGAVTFNGERLAAASAECILNPNRNGPTSAADAEAIISRNLGVSALTWVPFGLIEDLKNTDGHVDNVAVFIAANKMLVQACDRANPNYDRLKANIDALSVIRLSDGSAVELVECEWLPYITMPDGSDQPAPYLNFALSNDTVILPTVESSSDDMAARFFADLFPNRKVAFVPAAALTFGGGGPHCVTMQVPEGVAWPS